MDTWESFRRFFENFRQLLKEEMECVLSGNQIKSLNRAVTCLYRIGSELLIEVLPDKVLFFLLWCATWNLCVDMRFSLEFDFSDLPCVGIDGREGADILSWFFQLTLRTLNTAWSAFLSVTFKGRFFDAFHVLVPNTSCSVLLKVCAYTLTISVNLLAEKIALSWLLCNFALPHDFFNFEILTVKRALGWIFLCEYRGEVH